MRLRMITRAALLAALCTVGSATLFAQLQAGRILGSVYDPQHAGIPGATVTVTNVKTNVPRMAVTDSEGNYVVTPLDPGTYRVTAEIPGFQTTVREGLELTVGGHKKKRTKTKNKGNFKKKKKMVSLIVSFWSSNSFSSSAFAAARSCCSRTSCRPSASAPM